MAMRDLVPLKRGRDATVRRSEDNPFFTLHRGTLPLPCGS
jgi:hypothetical protein